MKKLYYWTEGPFAGSLVAKCEPPHELNYKKELTGGETLFMFGVARHARQDSNDLICYPGKWKIQNSVIWILCEMLVDTYWQSCPIKYFHVVKEG